MLVIKPKVEWLDEADYRLSVTSRASSEARGDGCYVVHYDVEHTPGEYVKVTAEPSRYLLTSDFPFVKRLYAHVDEEAIKKAVEEIHNFVQRVETSEVVTLKRKVEMPVETGVQGSLLNMGYATEGGSQIVEIEEKYFHYEGVLAIISEELKNISTEDLVNKLIQDAKEKHTKVHEVKDESGNPIYYFRISRDQELPTLFSEFEPVIKQAYGIGEEWELVPFLEGSENSPVEIWKKESFFQYDRDYMEVDCFAFVRSSFLVKWQEESERRRKDAIKSVLFEVLSLKSWEYNWRFEGLRESNIPEDLKEMYKEAKKKMDELKIKSVKKELEDFIKKARHFLENGLYEVSKEMPECDVSTELIDPWYYYVRREDKAAKAQEENVRLYGDLLLEAQKLHKALKELEAVNSPAGIFYARKEDRKWKVKVPKEKKGLFIGKGGKNVKALEERYGVKIAVV